MNNHHYQRKISLKQITKLGLFVTRKQGIHMDYII
jgi:hypothetical protein